MANLDLSKYGITGATEIVHNPSYDVLFAEETKPGLEGFEKGQVTELGAVNVMTGVYTGRSPKDKFFVKDATSENTVWWTSDEYKNDNKPVDEKCWKAVKELATKELSNKKLYVVDAFCGANPNSRLKLRFIMEVAWQAHFVTNSLRVRHEALRTKHAAQTADNAHHIRRSDDNVKIHPAFALNFLNQFVGSDIICASFLRSSNVIAFSKNQYSYIFTSTVRQNNRAANLLVSVTRVYTQSDMQFYRFIKLCFRGLNSQSDRFGSIIHCITVNQLCAVNVLFTVFHYIFPPS